jgi:DNA-binding FrmR family transcriptional regulator
VAEDTVTVAASGASPAVRAASEDPANADILRRLKSVEGHVRGIERMVEEGAYCVDVMNQILAVQRALKKVGGRVLDRHLHHCVTRALRGDDAEERERVIGEILTVFQATGRT